jgi:hypothetical protein
MADATEQNEMHAAIAERIEGIRLTDKPASFGPHKKMYRLEHADGTPLHGWGGVYGWGYAEKDAPVNQLWPDYSDTDAPRSLLDRVEARVKQLGHIELYLHFIVEQITQYRDESLVLLPASARVAALYAVAMSLKVEPKP